MSTEFKAVTCGFCRKSWKQTDGPANSGNPLQAARMFGQGATQGFICEQCNMFICESCFLRASRQCAFCGNQRCRGIWVKELTQSEQQMHRDFQKHILVHGVSGILSMIGIGVLSPSVNESIPIEKSIGIAGLAAFLMAGLFLRVMRGLTPSDKSNAMLVGCLFGGIWGIGVGTIAGWGGVFSGGAFGLGLVPWIGGCTLLSSFCVGFSLSMPARMLSN